MPFAMLYNFGSAILRSKGDTRRPLYALVAAVILNIGLNVLFVTVVPWGVAGIAIATCLANATSAGIIIWFLMREEPPYRLEWRRLRVTKSELLIILKIGLPAGLQGVVFSLSNVVIQSGINSFGSACTAGVAAAVNYEFYCFFVVNSFVQAAVTFIGQNYAAHRFDRCDRVLGLCMLFSVVSMGALCVLLQFTGRAALGVFTADPQAIEYGVQRLAMVQVFQWIVVSYEVPAGAMRGMGWSMTPTAITIVGSCVLRIVWVLTVFAASPDFATLMVVYPITWVVTGIAMCITFFFVRKRAFAKAAAEI
jgi:Na+-driven multidrug efflux pump